MRCHEYCFGMSRRFTSIFDGSSHGPGNSDSPLGKDHAGSVPFP